MPLAPPELSAKVAAIWRHESQKDAALFPGADPREFWQRAADRNRATAAAYDALGLPEYEGLEAFRRYYPAAPGGGFVPPAAALAGGGRA